MPAEKRTTMQRFMAFVDILPGPKACWLWKGYRRKNGVGFFSMGDKVMLAHRASAQLHHLPMQDWHCVVRACGNTGCVNPDHIALMLKRDVQQFVADIPPEPGLVSVWVNQPSSHRIKAWMTPAEAKRVRQKQRTGTFCKICDAMISGRWTRAAYCSAACRQKAHIKRVAKRKCPRCQQPVPYVVGRSYRYKYCGAVCRDAANGEHMGRVNPYRNGEHQAKKRRAAQRALRQQDKEAQATQAAQTPPASPKR